MQLVVEEAKMSGQVILLLDEIHRLDKAKQDFLLPHLENGKSSRSVLQLQILIMLSIQRFVQERKFSSYIL